MTSIARRLGVTSAAVAVGLAGLFVGSGTSGAGVDTGTRCVVTSGFYSFPYGYDPPILLQAFHQRECYNPESVTHLPVSIERQGLFGIWTTVASGTGEVTYVCNNSTTRTYRSVPGSSSGAPFNCG
ncbi:MAG: hypothetical protein ACREX8_13295 [Gammaproteobacteria bacterium]